MSRYKTLNNLKKKLHDKPYFKDVEIFIRKLEVFNKQEITEYLKILHPSDIAAYIQILKKDQRKKLLEVLNEDFDIQILAELKTNFLEKIINEIEPNIIEKALDHLDSDDAARIIEVLEDDKRNKFLSKLQSENRFSIERSLAYLPNTAGRLMQSKVVMVPENFNVGNVIDYLRSSKNIPKIFYDIFVTDVKKSLVGSISLSKIITSERSRKVIDLMIVNLEKICVNSKLDQEEVADFFRKRNLTSVAVVDEDYKVLGSIYVDDIVDVIDTEAEEDLLKLGGVGEQNFYDAIISITKSRFTWLMFNLIAAFLATFIIKNFENSIEKLAILAALMPIVASMGGCSGTQSLTTAVRAIAMKQLTLSNAFRATGKELIIGILNGLIFAIISGVITFLIFNEFKISIIISISLFINLVFGAFFGSFVPIILTKYGIDPALASGTFVIMLTDIFGFFMFLSLATIFLI